MSWQALARVSERTVGNPPLKAVLIQLANHANPDDGLAWPSVARLSGETEMGESTIRRCLAELRNRGLIEVVHPARQHKPATYRLVWSAISDLSLWQVSDPDLSERASRPLAAGPEPKGNRQDVQKTVRPARGDHVLLKPFLEMTRLEMPEIGPGKPMSGGEWQKRWEQPLRAILHAAKGDVDRAKKAMWEAIRASRNRKPDPLTIEAPQSILRMTRDALARSAPAVSRPDGPLEVGRF